MTISSAIHIEGVIYERRGNSTAERRDNIKTTVQLALHGAADYLNKDMMIGLAIVNPVYFMCMMIGAMKTIQISTSIILGAMLGPLFYFVSPEWCILYGGFVAGTIAFFVGENNVD